MNLTKSMPLQRVWGWKIAAYLFTAGAGAGAYVMGTSALLFGTAPAEAGVLAMVLGVVLVGLAVPFLVWDLGRPLGFLRVLVRARRSWISRGAWILISFSALAVLTLGVGVWPGTLMQADSGLWTALLGLGMAAGVAVGSYTGLLIGTMLSRPFWNTPVIPALFLVSALSAGIAATVLIGTLVGGAALHDPMVAFAGALRPLHVALLVGELLLIYFHLNVSVNRARVDVQRLVSGSLSQPFWWLVIGVGLVLPILVETAGAGAGVAVELLGHAGVLVGGFTLRQILLMAGTRAQIENLGAPFVIRPEA